MTSSCSVHHALSKTPGVSIPFYATTVLATSNLVRQSHLNSSSFKLASWFWNRQSPQSSTSSSHPPSPSHSEASTQPHAPSIKRIRPMSSSHSLRPSPELSPSFCFNTSYLRDFLRLSRSNLDDTISTNLNSLITPSLTRPFDPSSTSDPSTNRTSRRQIDSDTCTSFVHSTVFPTWSSRSKVLNYCSIVATSPDPDDPDKTEIEAENVAHSHQVVNERLDPYSGRFFPKEPRTELLGSVLRNELAVENIVRDRTWRTLGERCVTTGTMGRGWQEELKKWEEGQKR